MGEKLPVSDVLFTSKHSLYVASLVGRLNVHDRYTVAGILCALSEIVKADGSRVNSYTYRLNGYTTEMIDYKLGIPGWCELAKNFIKETEGGLEINSFFMSDEFEESAEAKKEASRSRQKRYRDRKKKTPSAVDTIKGKTKSVKTEPVPIPAPDEPHYRTQEDYFLTGECFQWWSRFWKAWGSYGGKSEAAGVFRKHYKKGVIHKGNIQVVCDAAAHDKDGRAQLIAQKNRPIYPQGWLTAIRWEVYEEQVKAGKIKATSKNIEQLFPDDWKLRLSRIIWEKYPDLIGNLEAGEYKTPGDLSPELQDMVKNARQF